ncbi:unnamed protein product, partial [Chrysoparadoxa australica]
MQKVLDLFIQSLVLDPTYLEAQWGLQNALLMATDPAMRRDLTLSCINQLAAQGLEHAAASVAVNVAICSNQSEEAMEDLYRRGWELKPLERQSVRPYAAYLEHQGRPLEAIALYSNSLNLLLDQGRQHPTS